MTLLQFYAIFSTLLALALGLAHLYRRRRRAPDSENDSAIITLAERSRELTEINRLSIAITSTLALDEVLKSIVTTLMRFYPEHCIATVQLLDPQTYKLYTRASSIPLSPASQQIEFPAGEGIVGVAIREQHTVNVPNVLEDPRYMPGPTPPTYRALIVTPLVANEEVLGALSLNSTRPGDFTAEDVLRLESIARYAAIAVQNARLYEQAQQELQERQQAKRSLQNYAHRLQILHEIDQAIVAARAPRTIALAALGYLRQLIPCQRLTLVEFQPDAPPQVLAIESDQHLKTDIVQRTESSIRNILSQGHIQGVDDLESLDDPTPWQRALRNEGIRAYFITPLLVHGELIGALHLEATTPHAFTAQDIDTAAEVGALLAVAIRQARLYRALQQRADELAQATREAQEARAAAEAANQTKSIFLANMSHELRTPLNAILGFAQLLDQDETLQPQQHENLAIILRSGEHLLTLINDILEFSKMEAGHITLQLQPCDLYRLLDGLEDMFRIRAEQKGLTLACERDPATPRWIETDEGKLRQILINLLSNAVKYTSTGGVTLYTTYDEEHLICVITDTGPGIPTEEQVEIFEPFLQTTNGQTVREGSGLGLPISHRFSALLGGTLTVESVVGRGSTFRLRIPVVPIAAPIVETPISNAPPRQVIGLAPNQPAYRLLIAEDRPINRQMFVQLLKPLQLPLRTASDGQEALEIWERWQPDLIWMDMRMPVLDGRAVTREVRAREAASGDDHRTVIIAVTGVTYEKDQQQIMAEGCDDLMRKPFSRQEIFALLAKHLGLRYLYAAPTTEGLETRLLTAPATDTEFPGTWLLELEQATHAADLTQILALIEQLRPQQPQQATQLIAHANNFDYEAIINWVQATRAKSKGV